jgi:hypothetical protein
MFGTDTNDRPHDGNRSGHTGRLRYRRITFGHNGNTAHSEELSSGPNCTASPPGYPERTPTTDTQPSMTRSSERQVHRRQRSLPADCAQDGP